MANRLLEYKRRPSGAGARGPTDEPFDPAATSRNGSADWKAAIGDYIAANPGISLGAALLAGVLLGWLIKRR